MHLDRAQEQGDIDLLPTNWRLLYLHALIASSKLLYDVAICNDDFAPIFPKLSLEHMLECELAFMRLHVLLARDELLHEFLHSFLWL